MNRFLKNIFFIVVFLCFTFFKIAAQEEENGQTEPDSAVVISDSIRPVEVVQEVYFTPKSEQDPFNYQVRKVSSEALDSLKKQDAFWYADSSFGTKKKAKQKESTDFRHQRSHWLSTKTLVFILLIAVAFIVFFLVRTNVIAAKRSIKVQGEEKEELENIFGINYQKELDKALKDKNYRLAVRLMFLRQLKILSDKNIIQYKQERTNLDYLTQIHSSKYYKDFFRLTRNYEYVWYGKFELKPETFNVIKSEFENFDRNLN
jgi:hypothetical protein